MLKTVEVDYLPEVLENNTIYISNIHQICVHSCPCGCGLPVFLTTDDKGWKLTIKDGLATISPSIQITASCGSHYWVREGQIKWV